MKVIYLLLVFLILTLNIGLTGCSVLSHEKDYYQVTKCIDGKPEVHTYYGTDFDYFKTHKIKGEDKCE